MLRHLRRRLRGAQQGPVLWFKMGEMVDIAADTVAAAERALAGARAAHALAETAQRAATREPFLGTPTDY
uniref:Uncharacterized protein n=1 Tax=Caulobacter phage S2L TaxID=3348356 RepID=A0AB74UGB0_9VIRU